MIGSSMTGFSRFRAMTTQKDPCPSMPHGEYTRDSTRDGPRERPPPIRSGWEVMTETHVKLKADLSMSSCSTQRVLHGRRVCKRKSIVKYFKIRGDSSYKPQVMRTCGCIWP